VEETTSVIHAIHQQNSVEVSVFVRRASSLILESITALDVTLAVRLVQEAKILNVPLAILPLL
jgi:hypothetical protein